MMIKIKCLTGTEQFSSIKDTWDAFVARHFPEAYYLDHGWLTDWWDVYAENEEVFVFLAYQDDSLVGIIPLTVQKEKFSGFPVRRLGFMGKGFGREDFPILTAQQEIITGLFAELEKKVKWDIASFTRLGPQSNEILNEISSGQSRKYEVIDMQNPVIEIKGTYEDYFNSRSKNFRANYRKKSRRINEWGKIFFEHADARDLSCILEKIRSIGVESWQGEKGVHLAANEKGNKFLEAMADNFSRRGVLDVSFLYLNEEPIAYLSGARFKKTYFAIETGYKEKYFDVSPGMLLHLNVLERLYGYGDVELMDLGYDAPYKRRWTDTNRPEKQIVIYNKRIYPQLVCAFRKSSLYPRVLAVRDRFVSGKVKTEGFSKRATEKRS